MSNDFEQLKTKINSLGKKLQEIANEKEQIENEMYSLISDQIEQGYKDNDLKLVQQYINLLPPDSTMRLLSIYRFNKAVKQQEEQRDANKTK